MKIKKFVAWLLCISMMLTITPINIFAQENSYVELVENIDESSDSSGLIGDYTDDDSDSVSTELPETESDIDSPDKESLENSDLDELEQPNEETEISDEIDESTSAETNDDIEDISSEESNSENGITEDETLEDNSENNIEDDDEEEPTNDDSSENESNEDIEAETEPKSEEESETEADIDSDSDDENVTSEDSEEADVDESDDNSDEEDELVSDAEASEDEANENEAQLFAASEAIYYDEYGIWFNPTTHTITKGTNRTSITIPSTIDGYVVNTIGDSAFKDCYRLKYISIPSSVTNLGRYTFKNCTALTSITIPKSITSGNNWFEGCTNLSEVTFEMGTKSIPTGALRRSSVKTVNLPSGLLTIGSQSFMYCSELENISLPTTLTELGSEAFLGCTSLKKITIPKNVTSGSEWFEDCTSLTEVTFATGTKSIPVGALRGAESVETVNLPTGLLTIGSQAFMYCHNLKNITLPTSVTDLGEETFYECVSLQSITIPKNVTSGSELFEKCTNLTEVTFATGIKSIPNSFLYNSPALEKVTLPNGLLTIGSSAFAYCYNLNDIVLPDSLTNLGSNTFSHCISLTNIIIPKNVTAGDKWFVDCTNLTEVTFANGTKSIPNLALAESYALTKVNLPEGLLTIGNQAFADCTYLSDIKIPSTVTTLGSNTFTGCLSLTSITIPKNATSYSYLFQNCTNLVEIIFEKGTTKIPNNAITNSPAVKTLTIPEGVISIGSSAFSGCKLLEKITLPETVTSFSGWLRDCPALTEITLPSKCFNDISYSSNTTKFFDGCYNLTTIKFADGTTSIPSQILYEFHYPVEVHIPESVTYISSNAFNNAYFVKLICNNTIAKQFAESNSIDHEYNGQEYKYGINVSNTYECSIPELGTYYAEHKLYFDKDTNTVTGCSNDVVNLTIPETIDGVLVEKIADNAFKNAGNIETITMADTILTIGASAFENCINLKTVKLSDGLYYMGYNAFCNCASLKEITLPATLSESGGKGSYSYDYQGLWFENCVSLKKVVLSEGTSIILPYTFRDMPILETVVIPESVAEIGKYAFSGCTNLKDVKLPTELYSLGEYAFSECDSLKEITLPAGLCETDGGYWFNNCYRLEKVIFEEGMGEIPNKALYNTPLLRTVDIPDSVSIIGNYAFKDCNNVETIKLSNNLISLGYQAFANNMFVQEVTIPQYLTQTGDAGTAYNWLYGNWFYRCGKLHKITFEEGLTEIPEDAFNATTSLRTVVFPSTLSTINIRSFSNCFSLSDMNLPNSLTTVKYKAFANCYSLEEVTIPKNLTDAPYSYWDMETGRWFSDCYNLKTIIFADGLKEIPNHSIKESYIKHIIMPKSITAIRKSAFNDCYSIQTIDYDGSARDFNNITIEENNDCLYNATIYCTVPVVDTREEAKKTVTIFVEINRGEIGGADDYIKCTEASITVSGNPYTLDEEGKVELPANGTAVITVDGYNRRSINLSSVSNGDIIRLEKIDPNATPIIYGITINGKDAKNKTYQMTEDFVGRIKATVDWNGGEAGSIYIENNGNKWKLTNGQTAEVAFGKKINFSKKTYLIATSAAGKTAKKQLKLEFLKIEVPDNISVSLGGSTPEITSEVIPYFGDFKFKFGMPNFPGSVNVDGNKIKVIFGVDVAKYAKEHEYFVKNGTKTTIDNNTAYSNLTTLIKNSYVQMENNKKNQKKLNEQYNSLMKKLGDSKKITTGKFGIDAKMNVCGFIEATYDGNNFYINDGGFIFAAEAKAGFTGQFMVWIVPCNWEASISGKINAQLGITRQSFGEIMKPQGVISGELKGAIGAGPGFKDAHINGCGSAAIIPTLTTSSGGYDFTLDYKLSCYLEFKLWKWEKEIELNGSEGRLYPKESKAALASLMSEDLLYDTESFERIDRSYLDTPSEFVANLQNGAMLMSAEYQPYTETIIKTNIFSNSTPKLISISGNKKLLVWVDEDISRSDINGSALYYSYYNGSLWSEPALVDDDSTADFNPQLRNVDNVIYLVWENVGKVHDENVEIDEFAKSMEIKYATYDKSSNSFINITSLTDNEHIDSAPIINDTSEGAVISWTTNTGDNVFTTEECHGIAYAQVDGSEIVATGSIIDNLSAIDSQIAFFDNNQIEALYIVDTDGDISTSTDNILYSTASDMTLLENSVSGLSEWFGDVYCYYGGKLAISTDMESFNDTELYIPSDNYFVTDNGNMICFETVNEESKDISAYVYSNRAWSQPIKLVTSDAVINDISGFKASNGDIVIAYSKGNVNNETGVSKIESVDLAMATIVPSYDLSADIAYIDKESIVDNETVEIIVDVTNHGAKYVNKVDVALYNGTTVVANETITQTILPGETAQVSLHYQIPEGFSHFDGIVEVMPNGHDDCDTSNNTYEITLDYKDVSLDQITYSKKADDTWEINVAISNLGFETENNIEVSIKLGEQVLESKTVQTLKPLETQGLVFSVHEEGVEYIIEITQLEDEDNIVNNGGTITFEKAVLEPEYVVGDLNGDDEVTDSDAIYLMYYTFFPEDYSINQDCDFDGDGEVTDNDAIYLMYYTFFPEDYPLSN